jgi:hypothetical protein
VLTSGFAGEAEVRRERGAGGAARVDAAEQQVLGADVVAPEPERRLDGRLERLPAALVGGQVGQSGGSGVRARLLRGGSCAEGGADLAGGQPARPIILAATPAGSRSVADPRRDAERAVQFPRFGNVDDGGAER